MLSNAYFLAKFRFDTAENEPAKNKLRNFVKSAIFAIFANFANFANPNPLTRWQPEMGAPDLGDFSPSGSASADTWTRAKDSVSFPPKIKAFFFLEFIC